MFEFGLLALAALGIYFYTSDDKKSAEQPGEQGGWLVVENKTPLDYKLLDAKAVPDGKGGYEPTPVAFGLSHDVEGGTIIVAAVGDIVDAKIVDKDKSFDGGVTTGKRIWKVLFKGFDEASVKNAELKMATMSKAVMPEMPAKDTVFTLTDRDIIGS